MDSICTESIILRKMIIDKSILFLEIVLDMPLLIPIYQLPKVIGNVIVSFCGPWVTYSASNLLLRVLRTASNKKCCNLNMRASQNLPKNI